MAALPDLPPTGHKSCTRATLDIREAPLLCAVTVANIGQAGLAWLETETDYEKIWIPQNTEAWRNKQVSPPPLLPPRLTAPLMVLCSLCVAGGAMQVFEAHFPQSDGRLMVIIKATDGGSGGGGSNMLTKPRLQLAQAVHELVVSEPGCACTPRADRHDLNDSLSWPHQIPRPLRACVSRRPVRSVVAPCSLELLGGHVGFCEPYCRPGTDQHTVRPGAAPPTNSHCHCHCYCHLPLPLPLLCPPDPPTHHTHTPVALLCAAAIQADRGFTGSGAPPSDRAFRGRGRHRQRRRGDGTADGVSAGAWGGQRIRGAGVGVGVAGAPTT